MFNKRTIGNVFIIVCLMFTTLNITDWIGADKLYADENHSWPTMNFENEARWSANNNNAGSAEAKLVTNQPAVDETSMQLSYQMNIGVANWVELIWTAGELIDLSDAGYITFQMYPLTETSSSQTYEPLAMKIRNGAGSQSNIAYNGTLLRMVPNEWNTVRIDLPEADAEKNNIREFIFIIGGKYDQLEGRDEVEYLIRNAQAHPKDPKKKFEAEFKDPARWTAHNNAAGSVAGSLTVDEPTTGRTSLKIDLAMNPGVHDWVNYVWRPTTPMDLTTVKNLTFDVYPTTETGDNQIYEPIVMRIQNNGSTIYEKNLPRLTSDRWNQVVVALDGLERDQIDRIVLIVGGHYSQLEEREQLTYYFDRVQFYESALPVFYHDLEYLDQWRAVGSSAVSVHALSITDPVAQGEHAVQIDYVIDSEEEPAEGSYVWDISPDVQLSDEQKITFQLYPLTQTIAESEPLWVKLKAKVKTGEEVLIKTVLDYPLSKLQSNQWNTVEIDLAGTELTHVMEFQLYMKSDAAEIEGRNQISYILDEISSQQYDPAELITQLGQLSARLPQLKSLFTQAELADISTDYERIHLVTIEDFIGYALEDIAYWQASPTVNRGYLGRAAYVTRVLERLYIEAEQALQSYLTSSANPTTVPRYQTSEQGIEIDKYSFLAETSVANEETAEQRPVFFVGYGHNVQVKRDIPKLFDYGANIIQMEVGPSTVITPAAGWVAKHYSNPTAYAEVVDDVVHQGVASIKIHNEVNTKYTFSQEVYVEPNTTYQLSAKVKGKSVGSDSGSIRAGDLVGSDKYLLRAGTYNWEQFGYTFTTGADTTSLLLDINTEKAGETIWIDDIQITKTGSTENLVYNGDFEEDAAGTIARGYAISGYLIEKELLPLLDLAADHDIAVNLMLSPHYFPDFLLKKWPQLNSGNGQFRWFIEYVLDHPEAKAIMQAYIETVTPLIKNKTALHSLALSNEPSYVSLIDDYNLPKWQAYLNQTHGTIQQLNARYQTSYSQFSEIAMPLPSNREATPLYYDWVQFNNQLFTGWHQWLADLVRQEIDDIPIHTKLSNPFYDNDTLRESHLTWGIDFEQFSEFSDINGNDNHHYIGRDSVREWVNYLSYMDLQGSMKEAPVFDSEAHFIEDSSEEYTDEQIAHARAVLWHGAIHGRSAATIWTWQRSYSNGGWMGSIAHRPDVAVEVGKVNLDLNRLSYEVKALQEVKPEIEILYSLTADIYSAKHLASLDLAYEAANFTGHRVGFVTEKQLQQVGREGADVLIIPNATHIDPDTLTALAQYITSGGTVLVMDTDAALSYDHYGQPLDELARTSVLAAAEAIDSRIEPEQLRDRLHTLLAAPASGLQVAVKELGTGNIVYGVEWRSTRYEDKVLLHLSNLTDQSKQIYLEINGDPILEVDDLIANEVLSIAPAIELNPYHPLLVAIPDRWASEPPEED